MANYIPKSITYVYGEEEELEEYTEEGDLLSGDTVCPTWPIETGKSTDNALSWAGKKGKLLITDNVPIKDVRIVGLEERGNGGRAYKVLIDGKYYVDLREDVILDVIYNTGILAGGQLNGEFIWAKYGANLKLIRVGSDAHKYYIKETAKVESYVDIKPKDVKIGGMYEMKSGKIFVYLGKMKHYSFYQQNNYRGSGEYRYDNKHLVVESSHVFVELHCYNNPEKIKDLKQLVKKASGSSFGTFNFEFKTSISKFVRHIKQLEEFTVEEAAEAIRDVETKQRGRDKNPYPHNYYWRHASCSAGEPVMPEFASRFSLPVWKKAYEHC